MNHFGTKGIIPDHILLTIGWGYHLSLVQQRDDWDNGHEIALVYAEKRRGKERKSELVPLNKWLIPFWCDDDELTVDVDQNVERHAFGCTSEAELVAHVISEAIRYVKFINKAATERPTSWRKESE